MANNFKLRSVAVLLLSTIATTSVTYAKLKENFTDVISFGCSFTTPPDSFAARLTERYGYKFVQNVTSFAVGGNSTADLAAQLATYEVNAKFDPNALYIMYMGPNDMDDMNLWYNIDLGALGLSNEQIMDGITDNSLDENDFPLTAQYAEDVEQRVGDFISNIANSGANYIVVLNHFNEFYRQENTIFGADSEQRLFFGHTLSSLFNNAIYGGIEQDAPNANIIYVDYAKLVEELSTNPAQYFSEPEIVGTYKDAGVFDVTSHPTTTAHKITANYIASVVEAPSKVAYVREVPLMTGTSVLQNIRSWSYSRTSSEPNEFLTANIGGDYIFNNTKSITKKHLGFKKGTGGDVYAHLNYNINNDLVVGLLINASKSNMDFRNNSGKAKVTEYLFALDGSYKFDNSVFVYAGAGVGSVKYDINRRITLGLNNRVSHGSTKGVHYLGTAGVGYKYAVAEDMSVTPFVDMNYQSVSLKDYKESGNLSTAMKFKIPKRQSVMAQVGATLDRNIKVNEDLTVTPALTASYGYDFNNSLKKGAKGSVTTFNRYFTVPTYKADKSYFTLQGSVKAQTASMMSYGVQAKVTKSKSTTAGSVGLFGTVSF
jgi:outer membrane lipase/esterase